LRPKAANGFGDGAGVGLCVGGRRLGGQGGLAPREALAALARRAEIDMHEARARVDAEAEEPSLARRRL